MKFSRSLIIAFLIFPMNVMGVIPALLLWHSQPGRALEYFAIGFDAMRSVGGATMVALGLALCWKTVALFSEYGEGTPAPYDPPKKLVVQGPYIYIRNPMMVGVWLVLSGEAILFGSIPIGLWFLLFLGSCLILIPLWEEPDLEKRLGESYKHYKQKVPRWIPELPFNKAQDMDD